MNKRILFIDDQILHYDQAAGARASYMYLKLFIEMGLSVTFIPANFAHPEPYTSHMKSLGVKVLTGARFKKHRQLWFRFFAWRYDFVFFNRPNPTKVFIDLVEKYTRAKTLYQCHDLHYLRLQRKFEIDGDEKALVQSKQSETLETELISRSDVFLTFSQHEKDIIASKLPNQNTEVIPLYFYEKLSPPITDFSDRKGILYVGGFSHNPNIDAVLWFVQDILPNIRSQCPGLVFYIAGSHPPPEITGLANEHIKVLGYITDSELNDLYKKVRMVVVPLRFGAGVKGKTMEAIHHSLPLVSTSIGVEGIGLESIVSPADLPDDFAKRVVELYQDESELKKCSAKLHDYALENLSTTTARTKMEHILRSLIASRRGQGPRR